MECLWCVRVDFQTKSLENSPITLAIPTPLRLPPGRKIRKQTGACGHMDRTVMQEVSLLLRFGADDVLHKLL